MRLAEAPAGTAPTLLDAAPGHPARPGPSHRSSRQPTSARHTMNAAPKPQSSPRQTTRPTMNRVDAQVSLMS